MKKISFFLILVLLCFTVFAQEIDDNSQNNQSDSPQNTVLLNSETTVSETQDKPDEIKSAKSGFAEIPSAKRPKTIDSKKAEKAREKDETEKDEKNFKNTIKYGIPSEISELVEKLIKNDDPRFTEELYDVFQETKNTTIQLQILKYFTKQEDPCLEDFAVELINDPYDAKNDLVKASFVYISSVN